VTIIRQSPRLVDQIIRHLRELILTDQLSPGTQIRQVEMAEQLGVSRTPLREAIRVLEEEGLVVIANGNQTVSVYEPSPTEMRQIYQVREVCDGLAARLAAEQELTAKQARELEKSLQEMSRRIGPYEPLEHSQAHAAFHMGILAASGSRPLIKMAQPMTRMSAQMLSRRMRRATSPTEDSQDPGRMERVLRRGLNEHRAIYQAIRDGKAEEAERLARKHIRATTESWLVR
jgi:GntR family transcriptional regulator of vanillate catabolism